MARIPPPPRRLPGVLFEAPPPAPDEALPRMDIAFFAGFAEVVFAPFTIPETAPGRRAATSPPAPASDAATQRLILRRGVTGALDLYAWWDQARRGGALPRRRGG